MPFTHILLIVALIALVIGLFSKKGTSSDELGKNTFILFIYSAIVYGVQFAYQFLTGTL